MITEEDAKKKLCPMIRYCVNPQGAIQDRDHPVYEHSNCQASACMAWRISQPAQAADIIRTELAAGTAPDGKDWEIEESGIDEPEDDHPKYEWTIWRRVRRPATPELGYCGAVVRAEGRS